MNDEALIGCGWNPSSSESNMAEIVSDKTATAPYRDNERPVLRTREDKEKDLERVRRNYQIHSNLKAIKREPPSAFHA